MFSVFSQDSEEDKSDYNLVVDEVRQWGLGKGGGWREEIPDCPWPTQTGKHVGQAVWRTLECLLQHRWGN